MSSINYCELKLKLKGQIETAV